MTEEITFGGTFGEPEHKTEVADATELLEFANAVREAGGGDPIPELLPSVRLDATSCLIARNLNFDSRVVVKRADQFSEAELWDDGSIKWVMEIDGENSKSIAHKIADSLDLTWKWNESDQLSIIDLPKHIGNAARGFDERKCFTDWAL